MEIIYREAREDDAAALLDHVHKVATETDNLSFGKDSFNISVEKEARFISRFAKNPYDLMLVALDGDTVVANGIIERERVLRYNHRATLSITVLRDYWGQGIGTRLMELLIEFSRSSGAVTLSLDVRSDNIRAISLYKKFGFEKIGTYRKFFKIDGKYYDADLMQLVF